MKRLSVFIMALSACVIGLSAQTLHVSNGGVTHIFPAKDAGVMPIDPTGTITVQGKTVALTESTDMWVDEAVVEDNVVSVVFDGVSATVEIAGNIAQYVEAQVDGAKVAIVQSKDAGENTSGEITYRLKGQTSDGSFSLEGSYKSTIELLGLDLTNASGPALDIQNGKRIALSVKSGTKNNLADGSGSHKGCIVCKGHLELKGKGELTVEGNASHAIYAKEYIEMKNCTVAVTKAKKDGLNCNQYFLLESGKLSISGTGDDGIQVSYKDDIDREAEDTGSVTISGGTLLVDVTADASKGVKCEGPMVISGGDLDITVHGDGIWDSDKSKTKASAALASDEDITIDGGKLKLTAHGGGGKGVNCDGMFTVNGGELEILTTGGVVAYVRNVLYTNYTGNTDNLASDMKSSPKGIKADGDVNINGGDIKVTTTGGGAEGIESKAVLTINDGKVTVNSTDDAINSSSHMYIKGGTVTVVASGNDGLDSNGNLYIEGGYIMAFGASSPECGIDANEEDGYTVCFTGGTLLAVGGGNSVPSARAGSTQAYVSGNGSVSAGSVIALTNSNGDELASFTVPDSYSASSTSGPGGPGGMGGGPGGMGGGRGSAILITCPDLTNGTSYTLMTGSTKSTVKATMSGSSGGRPW